MVRNKKIYGAMNVVFLDIDGVLNDCTGQGIFYENSTIPGCVDILNEILYKTNSAVVIISSWTDNFDFKVIRDLLYKRDVLEDSIIDATTKDIPKEDGIKEFLDTYHVDSYIIIDDNLNLQDEELKERYIKTNTHTGLQKEDIDKILNKFE